MMMKCASCQSDTFRIGICPPCSKKNVAPELAIGVHAESRRKFSLPLDVPKKGTLKCTMCSNSCCMDEGESGYCGLRSVADKRLVSLTTREMGILHMYLDPLPTNCCASWFCPGSREYGKYNLAVFFYGCSFNCLFCQNYTHKYIHEGKRVSANQFVEYVADNDRIACVCFFGGSPEPQFPFALNVSERLIAEVDRQVRICWEWNGSGNRKFVKKATKISLETGGIIKFDLKAWNPNLHMVLTGKDNSTVKENFQMVGQHYTDSEVPILTATTLLVPYYVDAEEVDCIARFIASVHPEIPYSLLVFHPQFYMSDLPVTPKKQVFECFEKAKQHLKRVNIGNIHLLR
jgi:pyruvate formate lyase activating enzyme